MDPYQRKGSPIRSVKMMENMGSPKKTWVDHGPSHMFFSLALLPILFSRLHCFFQEEAMVKRSYILGMLPPPPSGI